MAAPCCRKVLPLTSKGRSAPSVKFTGGGAPPRAPVNFWTLVEEPEAAAAEVEAAAAAAVVAAAPAVTVAVWVT